MLKALSELTFTELRKKGKEIYRESWVDTSGIRTLSVQ